MSRVNGRSMPGEETSSTYSPAIGSSTSSTAETPRLILAQSSTSMPPSGRSAMICSTARLPPISLSRTSSSPAPRSSARRSRRGGGRWRPWRRGRPSEGSRNKKRAARPVRTPGGGSTRAIRRCCLWGDIGAAVPPMQPAQALPGPRSVPPNAHADRRRAGRVDGVAMAFPPGTPPPPFPPPLSFPSAFVGPDDVLVAEPLKQHHAAEQCRGS